VPSRRREGFEIAMGVLSETDPYTLDTQIHLALKGRYEHVTDPRVSDIFLVASMVRHTGYSLAQILDDLEHRRQWVEDLCIFYNVLDSGVGDVAAMASRD